TSAASASEAENTLASAVVYTATATDPDTVGTIVYSLTGDDAGLFNIDGASGAVTFKVSPDFEAPSDTNADNVYDIIVHANDGVHDTTQAVAITVTNVNDNTPVITSNGGGATASVSVAENSTAVTTVTATDADGTLNALTYSISGGADAAKFS